MSLPCCFFDLEASSLGMDGYPIQAAWSRPNGEVRTFYIDPSKIEHWTDWDVYAERNIHQITRQYLVENGEHPRVREQLAWPDEGR